jgi:hypothetical protein
MQIAGFDPEISLAVDQEWPPLSLCDSQIADDANSPLCETKAVQVTYVRP